MFNMFNKDLFLQVQVLGESEKKVMLKIDPQLNISEVFPDGAALLGVYMVEDSFPYGGEWRPVNDFTLDNISLIEINFNGIDKEKKEGDYLKPSWVFFVVKFKYHDAVFFGNVIIIKPDLMSDVYVRSVYFSEENYNQDVQIGKRDIKIDERFPKFYVCSKATLSDGMCIPCLFVSLDRQGVHPNGYSRQVYIVE